MTISIEQKIHFASRLQHFSKLDSLYKILHKKLLLIGGKYVALQEEFQLEPIVKRGQVFKDKKVIKYSKGLRREQSQCHTNISYDYAKFKDKGFQIVTGWALSSDGIWRQHTWGIWNGRIVESTVSRTLYFGYLLSPEESFCFLLNNLNIDPSEFKELMGISPKLCKVMLNFWMEQEKKEYKD